MSSSSSCKDGMDRHITPADLDRVLERANDTDALGTKIASAIALIDGVLDDLGENAVALSFNGGKDCTVLLHLFAAVLYSRHSSRPHPHPHPHSQVNASGVVSASHSPRSSTSLPPPVDGSDARYLGVNVDGPAAPPPPLPECVSHATTPTTSSSTTGTTSPAAATAPANGTSGRHPHHATATHHTPTPTPSSPHPYPLIRSVYFTAPDPFPALEAFVISCATRYALDLYRFGGGMKAALQEYLACHGGKDIKAILLGTRTGDPNGAVAALAPTDPSWPQVLRVHPVLDWSYDEVWAFLRDLDVSYCSLYDEGYTSLGSTTNTVPNPYLARKAEEGGGFEPAWKLTDPSLERAGRGRRA